MKRLLLNLWVKYRLIVASPLFGIILSILLYYSPDPYSDFSLIIVILFIILPAVYVLIKEIISRAGQSRALKNTSRDFSFVGEIDENGNFHSNSRIKVTNQTNKAIEFFEPNFIQTEGELIEVKKPTFIDSNINNMKIKERYQNIFNETLNIKGIRKKYLNIDYAYRISPPLTKIGDYIIYDVNVRIKSHAKNAFTNVGCVEGVYNKTFNKKVEMSLRVPPKFKIIIDDYWIQDNQGTRFPNLLNSLGNDVPKLRNNDSEWHWSLNNPKMNFMYLLNYRLEKK